MADQVPWHLSGDYFENCSCSLLCPCLVSAAAPLTARPTEGFCNVPLIFHIESGRYGSLALDGLNVLVILHAPGVMADGDWSVATYVDPRADDAQTEGYSYDLQRRRRWSDGRVHTADQQEPGGEQGPHHIPDRRQDAVRGNPGYSAHVRRSVADHASERGNVGEHRPSGLPRQDGVGSRGPRQYVQRSWHALG